MFMGSSGAGKSTIASFLKTKYPLLSDDIMILKKEGLEYIVYQFPFPEKQNDINKTPNKKFKIGGVYLLHKAQMCRLDKIQSLKEINQGFEDAIFNDINQRYKRDLIRLISTHNNFYHLYFRNDKKTTLGLFTNGERIEN
jgi:serine kinase of HPr protein (carbohydrate metabolism regulator)